MISTQIGQQELASPIGGLMQTMIDSSGTGRLGTPDDIATVTAFLLRRDATFITGPDLLVDGGVMGAVRSGRLAV